MASRLRPGSQKKQLKEKIVQIYESFFRGEDPTTNNPNFWDELLLLKPKVAVLEAEMAKLNTDQLCALKLSVNQLFCHCVDVLCEEHLLGAAHALQTLAGLVAGVCRQRRGDQVGVDAIDLLVGFESAEKEMGRLCVRCADILAGMTYPETLRSLVLDLLLAVSVAADNISRNSLLEYLMINSSLFEPIIQLLSHSATRSVHGHKCVLLLTLLVNYRKYESANPYVVKLSILDDELALNGYSQVITAALSEFNWKYAAQTYDSQSQGWLSSLTSMVGNMFVADELATRTQSIKANHGVLVALYEAVHLNRNFIATLTQASTDASQPPSPQSTLDREQAPVPPATSPPGDIALPVNLLVAFLEYCSIVMQDTKTETATNNVRQCFIILTCVSEDQYCNSLMHDANLVFSVRLHRLPMRHRKVNDRAAHPQPLATALLDLTVEFVMSHLMKRFPLDLYLQCVGIIHRVLCYQKRSRVRLGYHWRELWSALMSLLKFIVTNEASVVKKNNVFELAQLVVNIFNLFITYGDTFLPTPSSYDELYYELIRQHQVFSNLYSMSLRYSNEGEHRDSAMRLTGNLVNIRAICNHFSPKIEAWSQSQGQASLTEEQVLDVVRSNYESLTLKLQESLDQYERYAESPRYSSFFTAVVRSVIADTWTSLDFDQVDHTSLLNQLGHIS